MNTSVLEKSLPETPIRGDNVNLTIKKEIQNSTHTVCSDWMNQTQKLKKLV